MSLFSDLSPSFLSAGSAKEPLPSARPSLEAKTETLNQPPATADLILIDENVNGGSEPDYGSNNSNGEDPTSGEDSQSKSGDDTQSQADDDSSSTSTPNDDIDRETDVSTGLSESQPADKVQDESKQREDKMNAERALAIRRILDEMGIAPDSKEAKSMFSFPDPFLARLKSNAEDATAKSNATKDSNYNPSGVSARAEGKRGGYVTDLKRAVETARLAHHRKFVDAHTFNPKREAWRFDPIEHNFSDTHQPRFNRTSRFRSFVRSANPNREVTSYLPETGYTGFGPGAHPVDTRAYERSRLPDGRFSDSIQRTFITMGGYLSERIPFGSTEETYATEFGEKFAELVQRNCCGGGELKLDNIAQAVKTDLMVRVLSDMKPSDIRLTPLEILFKIDEFAFLYGMDSIEVIIVNSEYFNKMMHDMPENELIPRHFNELLEEIFYDIQRVNLDLMAIAATLRQSPAFGASFLESLMSIYDPSGSRPHFTPASVPCLDTGARTFADVKTFDLHGCDDEDLDGLINNSSLRIALVTEKMISEFKKEGYAVIVSPHKPGANSLGEHVFLIDGRCALDGGIIYNVGEIRPGEVQPKLLSSPASTTLLHVDFAANRGSRPSLLNPIKGERLGRSRYFYYIKRGVDHIRLSQHERASLLNVLDYVKNFFPGDHIYLRPSDSANITTTVIDNRRHQSNYKWITTRVQIPIVSRAPALIDESLGRDLTWAMMSTSGEIALLGHTTNPRGDKLVILVDPDDPVLQGKPSFRYPISDGPNVVVNEFVSNRDSISGPFIDLRSLSEMSLKYGLDLCGKIVSLFVTKKIVFLVSASCPINHLQDNIYAVGLLPRRFPNYRGLFLMTHAGKTHEPLALIDAGFSPSIGHPKNLLSASTSSAPCDIFFSLMRAFRLLHGSTFGGSIMCIYLLSYLSTPDDSQCLMLLYLAEELSFGFNCLLSIPELFEFAKHVMRGSGRTPLDMVKCFYLREEAARLCVSDDMKRHPLKGLQQEMRFKSLLLCCLLNLSDMSSDIVSDGVPPPRSHINGGSVLSPLQVKSAMLMVLLSAFYDRPFSWRLTFNFVESFFRPGLFSVSVLDYLDLLFSEDDFKRLKSTRPHSLRMRLLTDPRGRRGRFTYCDYCSCLSLCQHKFTKQLVCHRHAGMVATGGLPWRTYSKVNNLADFAAEWLEAIKGNVSLGINFCAEELRFIQSHPNFDFKEAFHNEMRVTTLWAGCETCVPPIIEKTHELKRIHQVSSEHDSINNFLTSLHMDVTDYLPQQHASSMLQETLFLLSSVADAHDHARRDCSDSEPENEIDSLISHGAFWSG